MKKVLSQLGIWILGVCWMVPEHFPPWTAFHTEFPAFFATALIGFVLVKERAIDTTQTEISVLTSFFFLALLANKLNGQYYGDALVGVIYIGLVCISIKWGGLVGEKSETLFSIQVFLVFVSIIVSFQAISQQLDITREFGDWILEPLPNGRARANLGQPNQAATTLVMGLVAAFGLHAANRINTAVVVITDCP